MCTHTEYSLVLATRRPGVKDTPVVMSTLPTQNLTSNATLPLKEPELLGKLTDSKVDDSTSLILESWEQMKRTEKPALKDPCWP